MNCVPRIQHILVAHDFGAAADSALAYAGGFAAKLGARVTVLHAHDVPAYADPAAFVAAFEFAAEAEQEVASTLQRVATRARAPNVEVNTVLTYGEPSAEIVNAARSLGADLIVMGTHGRKGMSHVLLGSVAEKVVRSAPCPVLTVHAAQAATQQAAAT
jgi:nucleotide-binding universal stress UspA family protein